MSSFMPVEVEIYVIYKNPSDYPNQYVCRKWKGLKPNNKPFMISKDLEKIHKKLPIDLVNLGPDNNDPIIIEVWI